MEPADTRDRIVEAAIEVFLEKGYAAATVRDICARAQANVAAVNYHFGSKEALHAAVLEKVMADCQALYPMQEGLEADQPPGERLRRLIANMYRLNFPEDPESARRGKLFWLEVANPSQSFRPLVERFMRPIKDVLEEIIQDIALGPLDPETLHLLAASVAAQCLFHAQNAAWLSQLYPERTYAPADVERLASHVHRFSLAGIEAERARLGRAS
ncbi:putative HTH-type transcriptional regulator YttP [Fundidesulfovibrio magnetotacticus]|uniref:Putative HTH-type transcriptional regulator YttP n=1 Tax=Fundidesulfovibrio magnetotacticus TaxID=2730080 RepID=A0A6V8LQF4_9BACT|nr:TetR/AcrR family transcriptional regulator [Fundidesulfovibrio magnetotacticus]GFK94743.1 putative HTH-type transcriptional regulator YttP [Fundidesulfovibrio magnetotacticus]